MFPLRSLKFFALCCSLQEKRINWRIKNAFQLPTSQRVPRLHIEDDRDKGEKNAFWHKYGMKYLYLQKCCKSKKYELK